MVKKFATHKFSTLNLAKQSDLLPFIVKPFPEEILSSWIARLANANFSSYTYFLNNLYLTEREFFQTNQKHPNFSGTDLDIHCQGSILQILSRKTGVSQNSLESLMTAKWGQRLPGPFLVKFKSNAFGTLHYCPLCLKEGIPYFRQEWKLTFSTICQKHKIYLHNLCPNSGCKMGIFIPKKEYGTSLRFCAYCGEDLTNAPIIPLVNPDLEIEQNSRLFTVLNNNLWQASTGENFSAMEFFETIFLFMRFIFKHYDLEELDLIPEGKKDCIAFFENMREKHKSYTESFKYIPYLHFLYLNTYHLISAYPKKILEMSLEYPRIFYRALKVKCPKILIPFRIRPIPETKDEYIFNAIGRVMNGGKLVTYQSIANEINHPIYTEEIRPALANIIQPILKTRNHEFLTRVDKIIEGIRIQNQIRVVIKQSYLYLGPHYEHEDEPKFFEKLVMKRIRPLLLRYDESYQIRKEIENMQEEFKEEYVYFHVVRICTITHVEFCWNILRMELPWRKFVKIYFKNFLI